jgi:hypothetical protein
MSQIPARGVPGGAAAGTPPDSEPATDPNGTRSRKHTARIVVKLAATMGVLGACAALAGTGTWSNLNATATNPSNSFAAGTVVIASNSGSTAALSLSNGKPGSVATGCIQVSYTGTLPSTVKLYGTGGGTGLDQYLNLVVTRGTFSGTPAAGSCTGFTPDATNYISQGAGVVYSGTVANWPTSAATALTDPTSASPAVWSTSTSHGYELQATVQNNAAGQGLTGTETFTFEADNN